MLWRDSGRHRVEDFARGVDSGLVSCPEEPNTSRLVGLANALRSMPLRPSPELTLAIRRRIVNAARASRPDEPRSLVACLIDGIRVKRGLPSTTVLLTAAVALVSIGFGTTQALPGDTLYGLKLRGEGITIALARSDEARGYNYLKFAGARLRDVSGLIDHDGAWREATVTTAERSPSRHLAGLVNSTLTTMNGYTDKGATSLRRAYQRTHDPAPLAYLDDFTKRQHKMLSGMLGKLPAGSQAVAGVSLNLVDRLARETSTLLTQQCSNALACQSQPRPSEKSAAPEKSPKATPSDEPATSLSSDISDSPDPGRRSDSQGTPPQDDPSSTSSTGPDPSSGSGSGGDTQQTSPSGSGSGSTGGDGSGSGSSSSGAGDSSTASAVPSPTTGPTSTDTSVNSPTSATDDAATGGGTSTATAEPSSPAPSSDPTTTPKPGGSGDAKRSLIGNLVKRTGKPNTPSQRNPGKDNPSGTPADQGSKGHQPDRSAEAATPGP